MKTIPIRHLKDTLKEPNLLGDFTVRSLKELLDGKNMVHEQGKSI